MQEHETGRSSAASQLSEALIHLTKERELLISCLKLIDTDCVYCKHNRKPAPCGDTESNLECDTCILYCVCKDCIDNSKWEWKGMIEGNG